MRKMGKHQPLDFNDEPATPPSLLGTGLSLVRIESEEGTLEPETLSTLVHVSS